MDLIMTHDTVHYEALPAAPIQNANPNVRQPNPTQTTLALVQA